MKVGDKIPVTVEGAVIAEAEIKEVGDGTVTFIVPAKRVVMSVRTSLDPGATAPVDSTGTEHVVDEVIRAQQANLTPPQDQTQATPVDSSTAGDVTADKVITSSSVPGPNDAAADKAKFEALDPAVQAQIMEIVNAHNAATGQANDETPPSE